MLRLDNKHQHTHIISLIQEALKNGQSQPWMYEVLALSMEIEDYPKPAIERVILSMSDFGQADFGTMMYSGAYLTRFGRHSAALKMYQQCSRMLPERAEPYVLGLKLAKETKDTDDIRWAACGVLENCWTRDYKQQHLQAEDLVFEQIRQLKRDNKTDEAAKLASSVKAAKERDISIRVEWTGGGDIDLLVEEPSNTICSFENPQTIGGGILLHDGCGPDVKSCYESYVCPKGLSGPYKLTIRKAWGNIVGDRAVITVTKHVGTPAEEKLVRTVILENGEAYLTIDLQNGRRQQPREGITARNFSYQNALSHHLRGGNTRVSENRNSTRVLGEFAESEGERSQPSNPRSGAFGVSPVVQLIPEGSNLGGQVAISSDRRYVRIALQPVFSNVTDVFTFSYLNTGN